MSNVEQGLAITTQALLFAMTIPATWFPLAYRKSAWRSTKTGQGLMAMSASLALLLDTAAVFAVLQITGGVEAYVAGVILYGLLNWGLWLQVLSLRRAQRGDPDVSDLDGNVAESDPTDDHRRTP